MRKMKEHRRLKGMGDNWEGKASLGIPKCEIETNFTSWAPNILDNLENVETMPNS